MSLTLLFQPYARADEETDTPMVEDGKTISIEYTLKLDDGTTVDTNVGGEPLVFEQGASQILPALESALSGLAVDEAKEVILPPEDGYGAVDPDAFRTVELEAVPDDAREVGTLLIAQDEQGNRRAVRVHEVQEESIVVDMNHPLAGQSLNFAVRILEVK